MKIVVICLCCRHSSCSCCLPLVAYCLPLMAALLHSSSKSAIPLGYVLIRPALFLFHLCIVQLLCRRSFVIRHYDLASSVTWWCSGRVLWLRSTGGAFSSRLLSFWLHVPLSPSQWCSLRTSVLGQDRSETERISLGLVHCGLGLEVWCYIVNVILSRLSS